MAEIDDVKKQLKEAKEELALYKVKGGIGLYYELNRIVNETIELSRTQSIKSLITSDEKGDKKFERLQVLIKNAKEHILDMREIKSTLNLTGNEKKDKEDAPFIETIAETRN